MERREIEGGKRTGGNQSAARGMRQAGRGPSRHPAANRARHLPPGAMNSTTRDEVSAFLRRWLPPAARDAYARLMRADPTGWSRHPHFRGGLIVRCALRGNGYTEHLLGIRSLDEVWPDLLERAVRPEHTGNGAGGAPHDG